MGVERVKLRLEVGVVWQILLVLLRQITTLDALSTDDIGVVASTDDIGVVAAGTRGLFPVSTCNRGC